MSNQICFATFAHILRKHANQKAKGRNQEQPLLMITKLTEMTTTTTTTGFLRHPPPPRAISIPLPPISARLLSRAPHHSITPLFAGTRFFFSKSAMPDQGFSFRLLSGIDAVSLTPNLTLSKICMHVLTLHWCYYIY